MEESDLQTSYPLSQKQSSTQRQKGSRWCSLLTVVACATTLGSAVAVGHCIGVMNSPAKYMRSWCNETLINRYDLHLNLSDLEILWATIVSIFLIGGAIGSLGGAWAANKFGRKSCLLITTILFTIGAIMFLSCRMANSVEMLLIGRLLVGLASGLTTAILPMYLSEIAPLNLRGTFGVFTAVGVTGGVVFGQILSLGNIFGTAEHWHYSLSFYAIFTIFCYLPSYYFPESPEWLFIVKGDRSASQQELLRLRGKHQMHLIVEEIEEMELKVNSKVQANSFYSVITDPNLTLPLIIVCAFQGGQQLSGINAIFYYSVSIFQKAGLSSTDAEWANLGAGSLNLLTSLLGPWLMAKFNRRPLMILSSLLCSIFLLAIMFILLYIEMANWLAIACILCVLSYIFFYQFGLGPIPYFIGAELFEAPSRPVAMAMGSVSSWSCNFLVGMMFPSLQEAWGAFVFLPFSITCILLFFLTKFYVPETKRHNTSEMGKEFRSNMNEAIKLNYNK